MEIARHDPLAEVSQLDHQDDAVDGPAWRADSESRCDHVDLAIEADVGVRDDSVGLADHGRTDQRDWCGDAGVAQVLNILDSRLAERGDAGREKLAGDLGRAERRLRHATDA